MDNPLLVDLTKASELLSVSPATVRRLIAEGGIPTCRMRRRVMIPVEGLKAYISAITVQAHNPDCIKSAGQKGNIPCHTDARAPLANPVSGMSLRQPEGRLRWITQEEAKRLITEAGKEVQKSPHLPDFIQLALNTGCRKGELLNLTWDRVDFDSRQIRLEGEHTKNGKRRVVPLNEIACNALQGRIQFREAHCPKSPWVFAHKDGKRLQNITNGFTSACKRAGIKDFRIHDLRHTCASWLVSAGVSLYEVKELLGHSSIEMTERYAHLAPDNLGQVAKTLHRLQSGDNKKDLQSFN